MSLALFEMNNFSSEVCCTCGVAFAMTNALRAERLKDHKWFYCPNGHSQQYVAKSEAERAREELEAEKRRHGWTAQSLERANERVKAKEYQRRATKGALTKTKKRIAAGTCPCCTVKFADLRAHMAELHPEFGEQEVSRG